MGGRLGGTAAFMAGTLSMARTVRRPPGACGARAMRRSDSGMNCTGGGWSVLPKTEKPACGGFSRGWISRLLLDGFDLDDQLQGLGEAISHAVVHAVERAVDHGLEVATADLTLEHGAGV